jgi:hypothetical protein
LHGQFHAAVNQSEAIRDAFVRFAPKATFTNQDVIRRFVP